MKHIVVFGTFDTKGNEYQYLIECIKRSFHGEVITVDIASLPYTPPFSPTISNIAVAAYSGCTEEDLRAADRLGGVEIMIKSLKLALRDLLENRLMDGVISLGGGAGTIMGLEAMKELPAGFPKIMVSTIATSAKIGAYIEGTDILVMNSIVDIAGLNRISRSVFRIAAGAIAGAVEGAGSERDESSKPCIAATMYGNTTAGVTAAKEWLEAKGYEVLVFHANGGGGRTMERLIRAGAIDGVLDLTTTEWADNMCEGSACAGGPARLDAAALCGVPQVVAPGALDQVNYGSREAIPAKYSDHVVYGEGRSCLMRTNEEENRRMGTVIGEKLSRCTAPCIFLFPNRGYSKLDIAGGPFWMPEADRAFHDSFLAALNSPNVTVEEHDLHINDREFGELAARRLHALMEQRRAK